MANDFEVNKSKIEKDAIYLVEQMIIQYEPDPDDFKNEFDHIIKNPDKILKKLEWDFLTEHQRIVFDYITDFVGINICKVPGVTVDYDIEDILDDLYIFMIKQILEKYYDDIFRFVDQYWD